MADDRRRAARLQGGINRGRQPVRVPPTTSSGTSHHENQSRFFNSYDASRQSNGTNCSRKSFESPFTYIETEQVIRQPPAEVEITTEGKVVLSEEPHGTSEITYYPNFLDEDIQEDLFYSLRHEIKWQSGNVVIRGKEYKIPRLVKWFGPLPYSYSGSTLEADNKWPEAVKWIQESIRQKLGLEFNSVLLNLYRNEKDSVDWHSDNELSMGVFPTIASVSLGDMRKFKLRKKPPPEENGSYEYMPKFSVPLTSGSLLIMDGCTQLDWQHSIQKEFHSRKERINLTFRTIFPMSRK